MGASHHRNGHFGIGMTVRKPLDSLDDHAVDVAHVIEPRDELGSDVMIRSWWLEGPYTVRQQNSRRPVSTSALEFALR